VDERKDDDEQNANDDDNDDGKANDDDNKTKIDEKDVTLTAYVLRLLFCKQDAIQKYFL
jgi:hypothetical protein